MSRLFQLLCLSCLALPAFADEASRRALAAEYVQIARLEKAVSKQFELLQKNLDTSFVERLSGQPMPPALRPKFEEFRTRIFTLMESKLGWDAVKDDYIRLYAEAFTEEELAAVVAFYKTFAGQSLVAKTPDLMVRANSVMQERVAAFMPELQQLMLEFVQSAAPPKPAQ